MIFSLHSVKLTLSSKHHFILNALVSFTMSGNDLSLPCSFKFRSLRWLVASLKILNQTSIFYHTKRTFSSGSSSFLSRNSCKIFFSFQNLLRTCPLESQCTSQWRMRSPYSISNIIMEYGDLILHFKVHWLSRGQLLRRFWKLKNIIRDFLEGKDELPEEKALSCDKK